MDAQSFPSEQRGRGAVGVSRLASDVDEMVDGLRELLQDMSNRIVAQEALLAGRPVAPDPALLALDARDRRALNALCSLGVAASTDAVFRKVASAALAAWACGGDAVAAIHKAFDDTGTTAAADPKTRLAGLGALVTQYHYGEGLARPFWLPVSGVRLDNMASLARVTEGNSLAPGISDAIAALLAPDAGEVGNA